MRPDGYPSRVRPGPKPHLDETRFIPRTPDQEEQLLIALLNTGTGPTQARNIVRELGRLDNVEVLGNNLSVRLSRYRDRLEAVGTPPWEGPGPRPKLRLSVLMGGAASTGAIGGQFNWRRDGRRPPRQRPTGCPRSLHKAA